MQQPTYAVPIVLQLAMQCNENIQISLMYIWSTNTTWMQYKHNVLIASFTYTSKALTFFQEKRNDSIQSKKIC